MKLTFGKQKKPPKRLSKKALRNQLIAQERSTPIVLNEQEYGEWLDHTVLARIQRGEELIESVSSTLTELAKQTPGAGAKDLKLVRQRLDRAVVEFQYAALKFNIMWRPAINGRTAENVTLWPSSKRPIAPP